MATPALQLLGLRAEVDPHAAARKELLLRVESGTVRLSEAAARRLTPPDRPVLVERFANGRVHLRANALGLLEGTLEIEPRVAHGRLVLEIVAARAAVFPIPLFVVAAALPALLQRLPLPGIQLNSGTSVFVDPNAFTTPRGVFLPPLRRVTAENGILELAF